jgi:phage gp16-like protein
VAASAQLAEIVQRRGEIEVAMTAAGSTEEANKRRALLARLHVAKRDADLDEDAYRTLMEVKTDKRSARELSEAEIASVIEAVQAVLGFIFGYRSAIKPPVARA